MENFVFGNLIHHKGLVSESAELQFIHKLCFQRLTQFEVFSHVGGSRRCHFNLKSDIVNLKWVNLKLIVSYEENVNCNLGQNIWRLFHFLAQFLFTTSETELDYYQQKVNVRVASRVAERLKTFKKISRKKFQENPWNSWIWLRVPSRPTKSQILTFFGKKIAKNQL